MAQGPMIPHRVVSCNKTCYFFSKFLRAFLYVQQHLFFIGPMILETDGTMTRKETPPSEEPEGGVKRLKPYQKTMSQ